MGRQTQRRESRLSQPHQPAQRTWLLAPAQPCSRYQDERHGDQRAPSHFQQKPWKTPHTFLGESHKSAPDRALRGPVIILFIYPVTFKGGLLSGHVLDMQTGRKVTAFKELTFSEGQG